MRITNTCKTGYMNRIIAIGCVLAMLPSYLLASGGSEEGDLTANTGVSANRKANSTQSLSSWSISFDNDLLVPGRRDQDYTYGVNMAFAGAFAHSAVVSLDSPLTWINSHTIGRFTTEDVKQHSLEVGLYGFTPEDISHSSPDTEDRPFASLLYIANTQVHQSEVPDTVWRSTLTVGVLGLGIVGELQNEVHKATGSERAEGWGKQISDGGELTARYSVARQRFWNVANPRLELKSSVMASVGYITEVGIGASMRMGKICTPWQSYNPELVTYGEHSYQSVGDGCSTESYFLAGVAVKARAYNAFLQGQFRNSEVAFSSHELNHGVIEFWAGYSHAFANGYRVSYILRGHTSEVKSGVADRNVLWGGLKLSKYY